MPTRSESPTAANISAKVWTASSQRPSTAKLTNAANVPIAAFTPAEAQHDQRAERRRAGPLEEVEEPGQPGDEIVEEAREAVEDPEGDVRVREVPVVREPRLEAVEVRRERVPLERRRPGPVVLPAEVGDDHHHDDEHRRARLAAPPRRGQRSRQRGAAAASATAISRLRLRPRSPAGRLPCRPRRRPGRSRRRRSGARWRRSPAQLCARSSRRPASARRPRRARARA